MTRPARTVVPILALAAVLAVRLVAAPRPGPQATEPAAVAVGPEQVLAGMDWLAGTWSGPMWGGRFVAWYSTPEGGRIVGYSRLYRDGDEAFYEFEVFEPRDGSLNLQPFPGGRKPASGFTLKVHDPRARKAVFENPDKDYPTRVVYQRVADDALTIVLDDPHGGSEETERFELRAAD